MKYLLLAGAFLGVVGYAWMSSGDPNVYPLSQAQVYEKLHSAKVETGNGAVFGNLSTSVSGNGDSKIYWNASGTFASNHCEAEITPEGADKSRITAFCGGGGASDGAAAGMVSGMHRRALIEHIDATLKGRPFDKYKAQGETAARWPSDARQPDSSYGTAVAGALQMDRDMHKSLDEFDKAEKERDAARAASASQANVGKPSLVLSH